MLERLRSLAQQGMNEHGILLCLREEFGAPELVGEVKAELKMLQSGTCLQCHHLFWGCKLKLNP